NSNTGAQSIVLNNPTAADGLASLTVNGNSASDFVTVTAVPPGVATTLGTLADNDIVAVTGAGVPTGTTLSVDGGPGFDTLNYDAGGAAVTVTAGPMPGQTSVTRAGSGTVVYQNIEQVNIVNAVPTPVVGVTPAPTVTSIEGVGLAG